MAGIWLLKSGHMPLNIPEILNLFCKPKTSPNPMTNKIVGPNSTNLKKAVNKHSLSQPTTLTTETQPNSMATTWRDISASTASPSVRIMPCSRTDFTVALAIFTSTHSIWAASGHFRSAIAKHFTEMQTSRDLSS